MIRIEVKSAVIREKNGTAKATGKPYAMRFQQVYIHGFYQDGFPSDVPRATTVQMEDNQQPYPVGLYAMAVITVRKYSYSVSINIHPAQMI